MKGNKKNPFRYYLAGTQVALSVLVAAYIGYKVDMFFNYKNYPSMMIFSVVVIFYSLLSLTRDVGNDK